MKNSVNDIFNKCCKYDFDSNIYVPVCNFKIRDMILVAEVCNDGLNLKSNHLMLESELSLIPNYKTNYKLTEYNINEYGIKLVGKETKLLYDNFFSTSLFKTVIEKDCITLSPVRNLLMNPEIFIENSDIPNFIKAINILDPYVLFRILDQYYYAGGDWTQLVSESSITFNFIESIRRKYEQSLTQ